MIQTPTPPGAAAAMLALLLTACGPREQPAPAPSPEPSAAARGWALQASAAAGAAIVFSEAGAERLRIACRRNPADLYVAAPGIERIGSEERLTLGAGDELATLVVPQDTPPAAGVTAAGQLPPAFVDALAAGREIGVSYGATQLTLAPPPADVRTAFAEACRAALNE